METLNEEQRRSVISTFYEVNKTKGKRFTVNHFKAMKVCPSTVYRILNRFDSYWTVLRKSGSGGHNKSLNGNQLRSLRMTAVNKLGVSTRKLARKYNVGKSTIHRNLRSLGAKCRARKKAPFYSDDQQSRSQERAKKLAITLRSKVLIMDDESYFSLKCDTIPGNDKFYTLDYEHAPPEIKFSQKKKFPVRMMVWLAISPKGVSEPYFLPSGGAMSGDIYRKECIQARLVPFIKKYHSGDDILFWPDGASAHYARATTDLLRVESIPFVEKLANPPNLPQARPIENVWSLLKSEVYSGGWEAKSLRSLKTRIKKCIPKLDIQAIQRDLQNVPQCLAKIGKEGPFSVIT
jgi:transposase